MPDALSKTVPIWCCVINRLLFPQHPQFHELYTPPQVVSASEHAQIASLLPTFLSSLLAIELGVGEYESQISKPLRPFWITPASPLISTANVFDNFHPVICCTVSRRENGEGGYIQGAGDDTENWAHGLSSSLFWSNLDTLLSTPESELPYFIEELVGLAATATAPAEQLRCLKPTRSLFVGPIAAIPKTHLDHGQWTITLTSKITDERTWRTSDTRLDVGLGPHKLGSRNLRDALPLIVNFLEKGISRGDHETTDREKRIIVACETGKDLSIGVALALLCLFFNDRGDLVEGYESERLLVNKTFIRRRLGWVSTSMPDANPSRATLQSVNSFLMERPR